MKSVTKGPRVKSIALWALVALNVMLVAVLVGRHAPDNKAHAAAPNINAAELLAVPGHLPGVVNGVVFLIDTQSRQLTALTFDAPTQKLRPIPPIDIGKLLSNAGGVRKP